MDPPPPPSRRTNLPERPGKQTQRSGRNTGASKPGTSAGAGAGTSKSPAERTQDVSPVQPNLPLATENPAISSASAMAGRSRPSTFSGANDKNKTIEHLNIMHSDLIRLTQEPMWLDRLTPQIEESDKSAQDFKAFMGDFKNVVESFVKGKKQISDDMADMMKQIETQKQTILDQSELMLKQKSDHQDAVMALKSNHNEAIERLRKDHDVTLKERDDAQVACLTQASTAFANHVNLHAQSMRVLQTQLDAMKANTEELKNNLADARQDSSQENSVLITKLANKRDELAYADKEWTKARGENRILEQQVFNLEKEIAPLREQAAADKASIEQLSFTIQQHEERINVDQLHLQEASDRETTQRDAISELNAILVSKDDDIERQSVEIDNLKHQLLQKEDTIRRLESGRALMPPPDSNTATASLGTATLSGSFSFAEPPSTPVTAGPSNLADPPPNPPSGGQKRRLEDPDIVYRGPDNVLYDVSGLPIDPMFVAQLIGTIQRNGDAGKRTNNCARSISKKKKSVYTPEYPDHACMDCTKAHTLCARAEGGAWMILPLIPSLRVGTINEQTYWVQGGVVQPSPKSGN